MEPLFIESKQLLDLASKTTIDAIGKPILESFGEQRRNRVLCDVVIKVGSEEILAHRCILYAVSKYCETLFTGSPPPTYIDGMLVMDLSHFLSDTVQVFIDLVYGETSSKILMVDIVELLRLGDFLGVPGNFLTEIKVLFLLCKMTHCIFPSLWKL